MATMKFEMTYHAREERIDRLTACIQYLGFNEIIKEETEVRHNRNVVRKLTDTGIILICGEDGCLITGFMGTMAQVGSFYKGQDIPKPMKNRIRKNNEKYAFLLRM